MFRCTHRQSHQLAYRLAVGQGWDWAAGEAGELVVVVDVVVNRYKGNPCVKIGHGAGSWLHFVKTKDVLNNELAALHETILAPVEQKRKNAQRLANDCDHSLLPVERDSVSSDGG